MKTFNELSKELDELSLKTKVSAARKMQFQADKIDSTNQPEAKKALQRRATKFRRRVSAKDGNKGKDAIITGITGDRRRRAKTKARLEKRLRASETSDQYSLGHGTGNPHGNVHRGDQREWMEETELDEISKQSRALKKLRRKLSPPPAAPDILKRREQKFKRFASGDKIKHGERKGKLSKVDQAFRKNRIKNDRKDQAEETELDEILNTSQRIARRRSLKKNKAKIARGRRRAERRLANRDTLKIRAAREARNIFTKKITGGKGKAQLSLVQRKAVEKQLQRKKGAISKLALRLLPKSRKKEVERLKSFRASKMQH